MLDLNPVELLIRIPVILLALTVHEFCHAFFALKMGDPTAYRLGRCTLNPLKHLDPLGTICLLIAPIGWAKPVPINPLNFRDRKKGILVSTAAGPASNVAQAIAWALAMRAVVYWGGGWGAVTDDSGDPRLHSMFLMTAVGVTINVGLAVFNCLPLYPLDGFHITLQLMPTESQERFAQTAQIGVFAIMGLVVVSNLTNYPILSKLIEPPLKLILIHVAGLPYWA